MSWDEMGHTDPGLALKVYPKAMRRGDDEKAQLKALVVGAEHQPTEITGAAAARRVLSHTR